MWFKLPGEQTLDNKQTLHYIYQRAKRIGHVSAINCCQCKLKQLIVAYIYAKWAPNANRQHSVIKHNVRNIEHKGDKRMCAMLYIQGKEHHTKHEKKGKKYLLIHSIPWCSTLHSFIYLSGFSKVLNKRDLLKAILRY